MDETYIELQGMMGILYCPHSIIFYMSQVKDGKIYDKINTGSNEDKPESSESYIITQSHLLPHSVYPVSCSTAAKL